MKKKNSLIFIILIITTLSLAFLYHTFFLNLSEDKYNKIMDYYIARSITDGLRTFNDKVGALRDFVHDNVHPVSGYHNRLDTVGIEKLNSGIGWCDQQARVFMQLARGVGITTRLLFLKIKNGQSPHSVAEALAPDGRWVIVDSAYKLDLINKEGNIASQADIKNDFTILSNNPRVKARSKFEERWADNEYLSIYTNTPEYVVTKEGNRFDFLRPLPTSWLRPAINLIHSQYLERKRHDIDDTSKFNMLKARGYHLLGYYKSAENLYNEIIENSLDLQQKRKAEYYKAMLLKDEKKYEEAYGYITRMLNSDKDNPYFQFLYGLRANILKKMARFKEAEEDLLKIEYSLDAS